MQNANSSSTHCCITEMMGWIGERWRILILRDALDGLTRFEQFQKNLGIAPSILSRRLSSLVEAGVLEKRAYCERPLREEYLLTAKGLDFKPVLQALSTWGSRYVSETGRFNATTCTAKVPALR